MGHKDSAPDVRGVMIIIVTVYMYMYILVGPCRS